MAARKGCATVFPFLVPIVFPVAVPITRRWPNDQRRHNLPSQLPGTTYRRVTKILDATDPHGAARGGPAQDVIRCALIHYRPLGRAVAPSPPGSFAAFEDSG